MLFQILFELRQPHLHARPPSLHEVGDVVAETAGERAGLAYTGFQVGSPGKDNKSLRICSESSRHAERDGYSRNRLSPLRAARAASRTRSSGQTVPEGPG